MAITEPVGQRGRLSGMETRTDDRCVTVHLLTYRARGYWYADCPELTLRAKGRTEDEAVASLREAIAVYVDTAKDLGRVTDLIPRRAPLSEQVRARARVAAMLLMGRPGSYITEVVTLR